VRLARGQCVDEPHSDRDDGIDVTIEIHLTSNTLSRNLMTV
jgi:hypothetical protein